jgi:hypothetical protein
MKRRTINRRKSDAEFIIWLVTVRLYLSAAHLCRNPACDQMHVFLQQVSGNYFPDFPNGEKTRMALKSMSVAKLKDLMGQVDAAIAQKVGARRRELEAQLSALAHHDPRGTRGTALGRDPRGVSRAEVSQSERPVADLGRSRSATALGA